MKYYVYPGIYRKDIDVVSEITGVEAALITSRNQTPKVVMARHILFYARHLQGLNLHQISKDTSITNHSTVIYAINTVKNRLQTDHFFRPVVGEMVNILGLMEEHNEVLRDLKKEFWIN
jgi:chromosomal replication initiation ATPase DnaA